uniref:Olfactory receptor 122 n=1 Tax=Aulacocentrum confusum TaxID=2767324 RepID=A0A7G8Z9E1_9HYME|nr:olfactory receptor 122 [Aulacocentrum confusum]
MHELFDRIQTDWMSKRSETEIKTMIKYAEEARQFTNFYALFMYFTTFMYCCMPIIPKILDLVLPLNESRPAVYLFQAEYFIDQEKFYYFILIHSYISCVIAVSILLAIDTEYAIHVYHGCSIFAAVRCQLENLTHHAIEDCIKHHKKSNRVCLKI